MVKLEEVPDEEEVLGQEGPIGGEEDWDTDSGKHQFLPHPNDNPPSLTCSSRHCRV